MSPVKLDFIDRQVLRLQAIALWLVGVPALIGGGVGGVYLLGYQIVTWARAGDWPPMPITVVASKVWEPGANEHAIALYLWLVAPDDWIGLHKILAWFPTALALLLVGIVGLGITNSGVLRWNRAEELSAQRAVEKQRAKAERGLK